MTDQSDTARRLEHHLHTDGHIRPDARNVTFSWNEGPDGRALHWDGRTLRHAHGTSHIKTGRVTHHDFAADLYGQTQDAPQGWPGLYLEARGMTGTVPLNVHPFGPALAGVLLTYLGDAQTHAARPPGQLTVDLSETETLMFTPRIAAGDDHNSGWTLLILNLDCLMLRERRRTALHARQREQLLALLRGVTARPAVTARNG